jgi:hypothetical protein
MVSETQSLVVLSNLFMAFLSFYTLLCNRTEGMVEAITDGVSLTAKCAARRQSRAGRRERSLTSLIY